MDVGTISSDRTTFDIAGYDETNSVLTQTDNGTLVTTRWIYKDEDNRAVVLQKTDPSHTVFARGTKLHISRYLGAAKPKHQHDSTTEDVVGKLAIDVDFANPNLKTKLVSTADGQTTTAYYVPVILK